MSKEKKILALDIGYGFCKVMHGAELFKNPSAVAIAKSKLVNSIKPISFEGKEYIIGEDALSEAIKTRDYSFIYKYSPLFIYDAFTKLGIVDKINDYTIHTGLSLYDIDKSPEFKKEFKNRKEEFINRISKFTVNGNTYTPKINLYAQGQGSYFDYCATNGDLQKGIDVVVDIGYRTNDIIVFFDGSPLKSDSNADDKGVNLMINELKMYLNKEYDITFSEQEVIEIFFKRELSFYGQTKQLDIKIDEIIDGYFEILFSSLKADYGKVLKSATRVIISGGGAYLLEGYKDKFPPNIFFDTSRSYEFANVRGYYNG